MTTRIERPAIIWPEDLDRYLAGGWYRIGLNMVAHQYVLFEGVLRSALWTRLPLGDYRMSRSNRRLLSRVQRRFTLREAAATIDLPREEIYGRYREVAHGERPDTLHGTLYGEEAASSLFDTQEISLWDADRLVAFSWFDVGRDSLQSLQGIYDPDYAGHSLGYASLLLEIDWAQRRGLRYHYAGYVLPGEPAMDYKHRVGALEAFDPTQERWLPHADLPPARRPLERLVDALDAVAQRLAGQVEVERVSYPFYELPAQRTDAGHLLTQPLFLRIGPERLGHQLVVQWRLESCTYDLLRATRLRRQAVLARRQDEVVTIELWARSAVLASATSAEEIAAIAGAMAGR